jgi:hypothetical protein
MFSAILLLLGFVYSYFFPLPNVFQEIPLTGVVSGFFLAGTIFFGYLAFIPAIFFGLQLGADRNAAIFLYIIPSLIATYAGTKIGFALQRDFMKKKNFMDVMKISLQLFIMAIILALIMETITPYIMEIWPKDLFGLNVVKGKSAFSLIGDISKLTRRT